MNDSQNAEVSAVLLRFSLLSKVQRLTFMDRLNAFVYSSPQKQLKLMEDRVEECRDSELADIQQVAEAAADYVATRGKKSR